MQARASQGLCAVQRTMHAGLEFGLTPWQAGQPALTRVPVARWRVEQHLLQSESVKARGNFARRPRVGKQKLHGLEAVPGSGCKTVQKSEFRIKQ